MAPFPVPSVRPLGRRLDAPGFAVAAIYSSTETEIETYIILTYNDRTVTHLHIKWGVAVGPTVIGAGTRHLPFSRIHAPITNPR